MTHQLRPVPPASEMRLLARTPERSRPLGFYLAAGALLVALNLLGVGLYRKLRAAPSLSPLAAAPATAPGPGSMAAPPSAADAPGSGVAHALRASGLAALDRGDYQRAIRDFTQVAKLSHESGDIPELLRITRELRDHARSAAPAAPQAPDSGADDPRRRLAHSHAPEPKRVLHKPDRPTTVAARAPPEPEAPDLGMLVVTSTPPGAAVEVDGLRADVTPARLKLPWGWHRITLLQGKRRVFERRVRVSDTAVASLNADLTVPREEAEPPVPEPEVATPPQVLASVVQPPASSAARDYVARGEVYVLSPEIYGDVFINGVHYGLPPLLAKDVPVGRATVEIRVHGLVRRSLVVQVSASMRQVARVR